MNGQFGRITSGWAVTRHMSKARVSTVCLHDARAARIFEFTLYTISYDIASFESFWLRAFRELGDTPERGPMPSQNETSRDRAVPRIIETLVRETYL